MAMSIQYDQASLDSAEKLLEIKFGPQAAQALNQAAAAAKMAMADAIAADLHVKTSDVKRFLFVQPATADKLEAVVYPLSKKGGIPLITLGATGPEPSRGKGSGVSVTGLGAFPHAFIATMGAGHRGVFQRVGSLRKSVGAWSKNLPIKELMTEPIPSAFRRLIGVGQAKGQEALQADLPKDLAAALKKSA